MTDIIAGRNPVIELLRSGRTVSKVVIAQGTQEEGLAELLRLARERGIPVGYAARVVLNKEANVTSHQGVIAYAAARKEPGFDDLAEISKQRNEPPLYVIMDGMEDPHNFGAIIRTAEAAGIHAVLIRSRREVGLTPVVAKASAGAIEYVPVVVVSNITQSIIELQKKGVWVTGIEASGKASFTEIDSKSACAIVIGGEGNGISDLVKKHCDFLVSIPMGGRISSLNASVAAAIVMYEAYRQRTDGFKKKIRT
jgi:23S rRNA (guanosine2251-2'-O)-methyltransferase